MMEGHFFDDGRAWKGIRMAMGFGRAWKGINTFIKGHFLDDGRACPSTFFMFCEHYLMSHILLDIPVDQGNIR